MPAVLIESAPVVDEMAVDLRQRIEDFPAELPFDARLSVVSTLPEDPPTLSYLGRMAALSGRVGLHFAPHYVRRDEDAAIEKILELNDADGSATMVMMPLADKSRESEVRSLISPYRDPDALGWVPNEEGGYPDFYPNYPATPLSVLRLAEQAMGAPLEQLIADGELDPERLVFYGRGKLVNMPAEEILRRRLKDLGIDDVDFTVISKENGNLDLINSLGDRADIILAAVGVREAAGVLRPAMLRRPRGSRREPLAVIDAAFCTGPDGKPYGNLHPSVYDPSLDFTVKVTPYDKLRGPVKGVGPLTAGFLLKHTVDTAERDARRFVIADRV